LVSRYISSAAGPQPKLGYFPQRRKGRKEIKLPDVALLAALHSAQDMLGIEQIPFWIATAERKICPDEENSYP
jgi:hypothetical protein